jgi:hypothetical protein
MFLFIENKIRRLAANNIVCIMRYRNSSSAKQAVQNTRGNRRHMVSSEDIRTFGVIDEHHGGGGCPVLLDPKRPNNETSN